MKINLKELLLRVIILMIGLTIAHLGVTLFILADLGSDPFNVLVQGIFRTISNVVDWSFPKSPHLLPGASQAMGLQTHRLPQTPAKKVPLKDRYWNTPHWFPYHASFLLKQKIW